MGTSSFSGHRPSEGAADVAVGASVLALRAGLMTARRARARMAAVVRHVPRPPLPEALSASSPGGRVVRAVAEVGAEVRLTVRHRVAAELSDRLDVLVPVVLTEVLRRAALTDLVLRYVDLDRVVAAVDLDTAVTGLDVDAVVRSVDLDAAVSRVDLDRVVRRVDVDAVAQRLDVDAVAQRLDVDAVLDRVDLTSVVLDRVDLDAVVRAVLAKVDLIGLAEEVIDGVDLPEIIRESTGSMASDTVRGARMQGIAADEAVGRAVDRLLLRRGRHPRPVDEVPAQRDRGG